MRGLDLAKIALVCLFLTACATTGTEGTGTATPPVDSFEKVGEQQDKADARVSAGVQVARNANAAGKTATVEKELAVVASYLPAPDPHNLAYIAERVNRDDPAEYARAMAAGKKLLAAIDANWAKAESDAAKNKAALDAANKKVADLTAEVERVRTEGIRNAFTVAAGACFLAALGLAILGQYIRAGAAFAVGSAIGAMPYLFANPYFVPGVGITIIGTIVIWSLVWYLKRPKPDVAPKDPPA